MARAMTPRFSSAAATRGPTLRAGSKKRAAVAVLDELDGAQQALAAHLADIRVAADRVCAARSLK